MYKNKVTLKKRAKQRLRKRIRKKLSGTSERPRIYVFKSNRHIYTQVIDDENNQVLASASSLEKEFRQKYKNHKNREASRQLGKTLAERLKQKKVKKVVFDRGRYPYHGRVKELAETLRKEGLSF
ncbi:MAG: 50S ribosomal protein L18 [Candidatus Aminicenantes bacterium]